MEEKDLHDIEPKDFSPVYEKMSDWPIFKLSQDRQNFVKQIDDFTLQRLKTNKKLSEQIAETIYLERIRIKNEPWKVDPPNDGAFWAQLRKRLTKINNTDLSVAQSQREEILSKIIHRYSQEIVGTFSLRVFRFARIFLYFFFKRLLNAASPKGFFRGLFSKKRRLSESIKVVGEIEHVRELFKHGTVVVVPTHYSNLDSILIGYALDSVSGLPSFSYGAGLNLYNSGIPAFFMNRLGAYRVDRRKKNPIYLETLKAMSKTSIERGVNTLFFPGGTRSRSGEIEAKLKMGLLGTVVEAQRSMVQNNKTEKVFVVPLVLGYHFVLEAPFLIRQHLQIVGKEKYLDSTRDMGRSSRQLFRFVWKLFSQKTTITLSIGKPMDALGNFVDLEGRSIDARGKEVHIADYFKPLSTKFGVDTGGGANLPTNQDLQREAEYTKMLAARIVDRFYKDNFVLSSQIVAFTAFNIFKNHNEKLDLYNLLRLPADNYVFPIEDFTAAIDDMKTALEELAEKGRLKLSNEALLPAKELIADGIRNLGIYHANAPLMFNKSGDLESDDFSTLFYYHNHLENYGLTKRVKWDKFKMETIDVVKIV